MQRISRFDHFFGLRRAWKIQKKFERRLIQSGFRMESALAALSAANAACAHAASINFERASFNGAFQVRNPLCVNVQKFRCACLLSPQGGNFHSGQGDPVSSSRSTVVQIDLW
jgi:hypothetical protein